MNLILGAGLMTILAFILKSTLFGFLLIFSSRFLKMLLLSTESTKEYTDMVQKEEQPFHYDFDDDDRGKLIAGAWTKDPKKSLELTKKCKKLFWLVRTLSDHGY